MRTAINTVANMAPIKVAPCSFKLANNVQKTKKNKKFNFRLPDLARVFSNIRDYGVRPFKAF
jgi:hypothetical protein